MRKKSVSGQMKQVSQAVNNSDTLHSRVIALAGVNQAVALVHQIAVDNQLTIKFAEVCVASLFSTAPKTTLDVFGGNLENIKMGLEVLIAQLGWQSGTRESNQLVNKYMAACLVLGKKVLTDSEVLNELADGIDKTRIACDNSGLLHRTTISQLATLYQKTISLIPPKIMVSGRNNNLMTSNNPDKIRTLLMCGVRASILWRQVGGSRLSFSLKRKQYLECAQLLHNSI